MNDTPSLPRIEAVVIGASAGGVEALLTLLGPLRKGYVLPIIIVLHLPESAAVIWLKCFPGAWRCR